MLVLFRGPPGSGKSTAANRMFPGMFKVENDMYHMHDNEYQWRKESMPAATKWCLSMVSTALENGIDVCVCNTFTKKRYIEAYQRLAAKHGTKFIVHRCIGEYKNVHGLDSKMVESFHKAMEDWDGEEVIQPSPLQMTDDLQKK